MKKVYLVISEEKDVLGVFTTCEKAMNYMGKLAREEELSEEEAEEAFGLYLREIDKEY